MSMRNRGYTLVELLVVIAIIAILAAMIAPVLLQAKEAGKVRTCANNLRQLGTAMIRYMDDHDGYGLPAPPAEYRGRYRNPWILYVRPLLLGRYITQAGVDFRPPGNEPPPYEGTPNGPVPKWMWVCPGDVCRGKYPPGPDDRWADYPCWFVFGSSYLYPGPTAYLSGTWAEQPTDTYPRRVLQWKRHNRDMLLADNYPDLHSGVQVERSDWWLHPFPPVPLNKPTWVPVKSINILFLDLHVEMTTHRERVEYYQDLVVNKDNPYR